MRSIYKTALIICTMLLVYSCDYLDIVPDNTPTLEDAFKNRSSAEKSLFACYSYLPDPTDPFYYPTYFTGHDEFEVGVSSYVVDKPAVQISNGYQNTQDPQLDYWSGRYGGRNMFQAIRVCNNFLEGISMPRDMQEYERQLWIAEVKFLKAYYHFFLMQLYGPIPIIRQNLPLNSPPEVVQIFREPVDEVVDYIVQLLDEAVPGLPLNILNPTDEAGRITQPIALAIKAKVLAWAASPLFNGNPDYANWIDKRDKQLISSVYSKEKWERAAIAIKNAIDTAHLAGHQLYVYNKATNSATYNMNDSLAQLMTIRKAITERWNPGIIWSSMDVMANGKGGMGIYPAFGHMQRALFPVMYSGDVPNDVSKMFASFSMTELFYSKKGIPITEDPDWDYDKRHKTQVSTVELNNHHYIQVGQISAKINFDREPRFYADLAFDRSFFEIQTEALDGGKSFKTALNLKFGESGSNTNVVGYYVKKLVAFESAGARGSNLGFSAYDYRFPLIRLADLYLLYSEALNEIKDTPDESVWEWIDRVRENAGLKGVVESWTQSIYPNRPKEKDEMRKIIQQERMIELAFEGQRFWDTRRWKTAVALWNQPTKSWQYKSGIADEYYTLVERFKGGKYMFRDLLWPIRTYDLRINKNLEQTYGW